MNCQVVDLGLEWTSGGSRVPLQSKIVNWWIQNLSFLLQNNQKVDLGLEWTSGGSRVTLEFQNGQVVDLDSLLNFRMDKWWIQKSSFLLQNGQVVELGLKWTSGESRVALEFQNGQVVDLESLFNLECTSGGSRNLSLYFRMDKWWIQNSS